MAIDPYKGGKCWSCKYCEDIGYYDEDRDTVYKRKCNHSGKDYLDYCTKYCSSYIYDGKDSRFDYSYRSVPSGSFYDSEKSSSSSSYSSGSSSGSSSSSGSGKGCLITIIVLAILIGGAYFLLSAPKSVAKETTTQTVETNTKTAVIKHTGKVNLRKKATSKSDVVTTMKPGTTVTVFEETEKWAKIEYNGKKGWCFKKYLDFQ